jgi:hypothetical protein
MPAMLTCQHLDAELIGMTRMNPRRLQLREAKRRQRARERAAGIRTFELRLPGEQVERLRIAMADPAFRSQLEAVLPEFVIDLQDYPALRELAWNRETRWIAGADALRLYERNWRHVDRDHLTKDEVVLIDRLKNRFGGGHLNV